MKKTITFNFPDNFPFPQYYGQENIIREDLNPPHIYTFCACYAWSCPFVGGNDEGGRCILTGDRDGTPKNERHECPFYRGQEITEIRQINGWYIYETMPPGGEPKNIKDVPGGYVVITNQQGGRNFNSGIILKENLERNIQ